MGYLPQVNLVFQMQAVQNLDYYTFGLRMECIFFFHRPKDDKPLYWLCSGRELLQ